MSKIKKECKECKKTKPITGRGLCGACYTRAYFKEKPEMMVKKLAARKLKKDQYAESAKKYYKKNAAKVNKNAYERFKKYREENLAHLKTVIQFKCSICGYSKCFEALDFHHADPSQKKHHQDKVASWLYGCCPKTFKEKIKNTKLEILCANCHRELHAKEHNAIYK